MDTKEEFETHLLQQLDNWQSEIEQLEREVAEADEMDEDTLEECEVQIDDLRHRQGVISERLEWLRDTGESEWEDLKKDLERE